jgi:hypothetical protein
MVFLINIHMGENFKTSFHPKWLAPKLFDRFKCEFEVKTSEE